MTKEKVGQQFHKPKYSCIPMEMMVKDGIYSFTYNPEEQPLVEKFYNIKLNTLKAFQEQIVERLHLHYAEVNVVTELSSAGRLHYHGIIKIKDPCNFIFYDLRKLKHYGCYEIDTIESQAKWSEYCNKNTRLMSEWCKKNDIPYTISYLDG